MLSASEIGELFARLERLLDRVEGILPPPAPPPDWSATAFRWRRRGGRGYLQAVLHPHSIRLEDLVAVDEQKRAIDTNTRQFVAGLPANNVLLTGSRGTGKSSLIKAMLVKYAAKGLRLIEVDKSDLVELPDIAEIVAARPERFIVYCDDLTFDAGEPGYKALKVMLDGTIAAPSANMLIYATSNRRHLIPEYFSENLETTHIGGEVHPGESVEEKISLSERFGLWITFYPFSQDDYLAATASWLASFGVAAPKSARETRGAPSRSAAVRAAARLAKRPGRVAVRKRLRRRRGLRGSGSRVKQRGVSDAIVPVAAAVIVAPDGRVLLAQRPPGKAYAGYWEFPGGKIEPGESPREALSRELREELGIAVHRAAPWIVQRYRYPHAHVELHFFRVFEWEGEPVGHDGQAFAWQVPGRFDVSPMLPANTFVMRALSLPPVYGITMQTTSARLLFSPAPRSRSLPAFD